MRTCGLVILSTLTATGLTAQGQPAVELSAQATHWRLDHDSPATTRWGPTLSATFRPASTVPVGLRVSGSYAPEANGAPGLGAVAGDLVLTPWRSRSGGLAPYLSAGFGAIHFAASRIEESVASCLADPACLFEGVSYRSGWRGMLQGGVGLQVGVSSHVFVAPEVQLARRLGGDLVGPIGEQTWVRLGFGLGWR